MRRDRAVQGALLPDPLPPDPAASHQNGARLGRRTKRLNSASGTLFSNPVSRARTARSIRFLDYRGSPASRSGGSGNAVLRHNMTASKMSHIRPVVAELSWFRVVFALFALRFAHPGAGDHPLRQGRGALIVGSALIVVVALATAALAQGRGNQPRPRAPEQPPSGHQTEAVDLNEGKSAAELFKAGCAVCHQSAGGLAKGRSNSELAGFLRQHYTSGTQHAAALAAFLVSGAGGRGAPATATPARLNPNAPIERPVAPVGREEDGRKPQEAARPPEREPASKRRPPVAARPAPAQPPAAAPAAVEAPAVEAPTASASPPPPVEEKPAPPEIPL